MPFLASTGHGNPTQNPHRMQRRTPIARFGVDEQRNACGRPPETLGRDRQTLTLGRQRPRCHRVAALAGVHGRRFTGDAELPLDLVVIRLQILIGDRPVGQRRSLRHAVDARHSKVVRVEPPRLGTEDAGAAADRDGVVAAR